MSMYLEDLLVNDILLIVNFTVTTPPGLFNVLIRFLKT